MTTYIVTRHKATAKWIDKNLPEHFTNRKFVPHIDIKDIKPKDVVVGILPIDKIAELNKKNIKFISFTLDLPESKRGKELSLEEIENMNPTLKEYIIRQKDILKCQKKR